MPLVSTGPSSACRRLLRPFHRAQIARSRMLSPLEDRRCTDTSEPDVRRAIALPLRPPGEALHCLPTRYVNTRVLRVFLLVMRYGSASNVCRASGIKPASIHYSIRRLEEVLGVVLFRRQTQRMLPTSAAHRLYPCAVRLVSMWDSLIHDLRQSGVTQRCAASPSPCKLADVES